MSKLEIHEHYFLSGHRPKLVHSHRGGGVAHSHEGVGPATYTIDKDEWFQATGLRGGGRKRFTTRPTGPQLKTNWEEEENSMFYGLWIDGELSYVQWFRSFPTILDFHVHISSDQSYEIAEVVVTKA